MLPDDLIGALYEGVIESDPWSSFLHALRIRLRSNSAMLMFGLPDAAGLTRDVDDSDWKFNTIKNLYYGRFVAENPIRYNEIEPGNVYSMFDFVTRKQFRESPYYRDFCKHLGIDMALIACIGEIGGKRCWLNVVRSDEEGEFGGDEVKLLAGLIPHVHRALRLCDAIDSARQETSAYMGALDSARLCTVLLDADRRVIGMNEEAEHLFRQSPEISLVRSRLALADQADQKHMDALFRSVVQGTGENAYGVMTAGGKGRTPVSIMLRRSRQPAATGDRGSIAAIAYLKDPTAPVQPRASAVAALFGLKPTEARLAAALAQGADAREAAVRLGMTEQTVRTYVKRILQKTGTRRQAELVQLISTSLAVLG